MAVICLRNLKEKVFENQKKRKNFINEKCIEKVIKRWIQKNIKIKKRKILKI